MEIRTARADEYGIIAEIWHASATKMDGGAPVLDDPSTLVRRIVNSLANGWSLKVAVVEGDIVGLLAMLPQEHVLDQLFVAPEAQRQGIGAALLEEAKRDLAEGFRLKTPLTNAAGHRFYIRHGLRVLGDTAHPTTGAAVRCFEWRQ